MGSTIDPGGGVSTLGAQLGIDAELAEELSATPESVRQSLRERFLSDLYFAAKGVLGYVDVVPHAHGPLCRFIETSPEPRRLVLYPRGHLKSTLMVANCIRESAANPDETAILITNEVGGKAAAYFSEIKSHWERNATLRWLFPELALPRYTGPNIGVPEWNSERAFLPRSGRIFKEPTYMHAGVGAKITGWHFTKIIGDDLIGFEAAHSPAEMQRVKEWVKALTPLLIEPIKHKIDFYGTRWGVADLYDFIMSYYGEMLAVCTRGCREVIDGELLPIWPERFTNEFYDNLQATNPEQYYGQYENNPLDGGPRDFTGKKPRQFWFDDRGNVCYEHGSGIVRYPWQALDRVLLADPVGDRKYTKSAKTKKSDLGGIVVVGTGPKAEKFTLHSESKRYDPSEFVAATYAVACRWRPRIVGIEQVALASTLHYFEKAMIEGGNYFTTMPLRPKNRVKVDRIRTAVEPLLAQQRLFLLAGQRTLRGQIDFFPNIREDAEIDCLAYEGEVSRTPPAPEEYEAAQHAHDAILARRNPRTGY